MNILFVSTAYFEPGKWNSGLPNYLRRISQALMMDGHKATILYASDYNQIRYDGDVEVIAVRVPQKPGMREKSDVYEEALWQSLVINRKIKELEEKAYFDIIQFTSLLGIGICYDGTTPAVMRLSSYAKIAYPNSVTLSLETVDAFARLERESAEYMDGIYAPSEITARAFANDIKREIDVIESPFVADSGKPDPKIYEERLKGKKYALFFGLLYAEKGVREIAESLRPFLYSNPDYLFVSVGDSTLIEGKRADLILKEAAGEYADHLILLPALSHNLLYPIIEHSDMVVLPSYMENLSNACIESMYFGRVVIGTDGASFEQLIIDGESGFLCKIGDSESLLDKMCHVAQLNDDQKARIGEKARERVDELTPARVVNKLVTYYNNVIEESGRNTKKQRKSGQIKQTEKYYEEHKDAICEGIMKDADKRYLQYRLALQWMKNLKAGKHCSDYFIGRGDKRIAIYGLFDLGQMLADELKDTEIEIVFGIDRNQRNVDFPVYRPSEALPDADVMVVTALSSFYEVKNALRDRFRGRIISIEDVIFEQ